MTEACPHARLYSLSTRAAQCIDCKAVLTVGDGRCPRCTRPLDDSPHQLAQACAA